MTPDLSSGARRLYSDGLMLELGLALVEQGVLRRPQLDDLNARRAIVNQSLDRLIVREGLADETVILQTLAHLTHIPFRHIADFNITEPLVRRVPPRVALRHKAMPVALEGGVITLAVCQAPEPAMADSLRMLLNLTVDWVLCTEADITKSLKHFYGLGAETVDTLVEAFAQKDLDAQGADVADTKAGDAGLIRFLHQIIFEAIKANATDIHIEPFENSLRLRYRIDGLLQEIPVPQGIANLRKAISSCVKIMADLNIAERRKPHDGRIKVRSGEDEFDLRVSLLPTPYGETVCLRILNRKSMFIDLEHIGLTKAQAPAIQYLADLPHGVVLLTGPTGSGKTTTLYALLSRMSTPDVKIITVEDPIEYQMHGINQIQVNPQIGLTFASILRSILRHDPDIILIGEIRDSETADIAVRSSLTGHLVFSTLHTNDAPSAITRLADMSVEPYLIASCLEGAIAQRLVRKLCPACKVPATLDEVIHSEIASSYPERLPDAAVFKGHGCPDCNFTGYRGRIALFEIMVMNDALRRMVVQNRPSTEIKHQAVRDGLVTLRQDGWLRVLSGMTSVEEVLRVAPKAEPLLDRNP